MMMIRVIKTESDYENALAEIESLMDLDPDPGTPEAERLELITLLIQDYESRNFQIEPPDPIDAILFRMEQQNLSARDLIPYLGSRSKVSEVLSRKRPLTLSMIRALHSGLGIPAKVLLQESDPPENEETNIDWEQFPLKEMIARGWIEADISKIQDQAEKILQKFLAPVGLPLLSTVLYRKTIHTRSARPMDDYALAAWTARVMKRALEITLTAAYTPGVIDLNFMQKVARLSESEEGPLLARDFLKDQGIVLIIERHLSHTQIDGAALMMQTSRPVIGLTLRYDRIDNFWFTLMHELAHLALHFNEDVTSFYDDLDLDLDVEAQDDPCEREADQLAREALIPEEAWQKSPASKLRSPEAAEHLAKKLHIHPAIVAGRMRYEFRAYRLLNNLIGSGEIRKLFPEVNWS